MSIIFLVRHGQAEMNAEHKLSGQLEPNPLTEKGRQQARKLAIKLLDVPIDVIFSSDLERAYETAKIISENYPGKDQVPIYVAAELRERYWGKLEGKPIEQVTEEIKELEDKFDKLPDREKHSFKYVEGMESDQELMDRFLTFLKKIAQEYRNKDILIISHSNLIRTFLVTIGYAKYGELPSGSIENTGYIKLRSDGENFDIEEINGVRKQLGKRSRVGD